MTEKLRITIGVPSPERVDTRFSKSLLDLIFHSWLEFVIFPVNMIGSRIVLNRNQIVEEAKRNKSDYILWIDADGVFPPTVLKKLLAHDKEVVGATTSRRVGENRGPAAYPLDVSSIHPFQQLVPMKFMGFPCMLTKMSIFDKIERPYFAEPPRRLIGVFEGKEYMSAEDMYHDVIPEDEYFCYQLRKAGIEILCDMELTMQIGHIGSKIFYVHNPLPPSQMSGELIFEPGVVAQPQAGAAA